MNKEAPASWRVAEIVSGNGHAYNVRYNGYQGVEKVSRGNIRPYPPAIGSQSWVTGDIVEVFDENSWKVATVLKVLKGGQYSLRLHELAREIRVHKTSIRARQAWCDGQCIQVGKISGTNEAEPSFSTKICQKEDDCLPVYNDARLRKRKRASPFCSSLLKAKKVKSAEKDGSQSQSQRHSFEKVDAFEGNKYMQASFNYSLNGYYEMEKKKRKTYGVGGCSLARISESNESDSDRCSVGSCSVPSDGYNKLSSHYDADVLSSDGESSNTSWVEHEVASDNWRHASLASKGSKQDSGSAAFLLEKAVGHFSISFATDKTMIDIDKGRCDESAYKIYGFFKSYEVKWKLVQIVWCFVADASKVLGIKVEVMNKEVQHPGVLVNGFQLRR
ncbi:hypothetical protein L1987_81438 [Smallanthus sonchifolius]|uniref:Uncharacterized protein n=1 Tax=Smallanthus sonchifolius TaxID=185202 RepID=A0ACB8YR75_9ASTR|nr:hypothetical protein L1987_81438 [Smallanthus sonchifolius]